MIVHPSSGARHGPPGDSVNRTTHGKLLADDGAAAIILRFIEIDDMSELAAKECVPCKGGVPALTSAQIGPLLGQLDGWTVQTEHHLVKTHSFADFAQALAFTNQVGAVAEEQAHHPDIYLAWGKVQIKIWTHKIDGLTESDFILAAKIDRIPRG